VIKIIIFLIVLAFIHAKWEVQIEGKDGWAAKLPCWRLNVFFRKLLGEKPITGYHTWMIILFQMMFHSTFIFIDWSISRELLLQGVFLWYTIIEDVIWFIVNPHYTIKKFKKHQIEWHKRWLYGLPLSYWLFGIIGSCLIWLSKKCYF